jgi:hypothetical protein
MAYLTHDGLLKLNSLIDQYEDKPEVKVLQFWNYKG